MGKKQTADGRWIIGGGENSTDYKGFLHWRECYICLTESGATEESVNYLNALKEYALAHYALGEPIMPPSMTVWVVANGKATAVQADDVKVEDGNYTICGITYSNGAWDYSNAGQGGGGGGGGDYFVVTIAPDPDTNIPASDKTYAEIVSANSDGKIILVYVKGMFASFAFIQDGAPILASYSYSLNNSAVYVITVMINSDNSIEQSMATGTL